MVGPDLAVAVFDGQTIIRQIDENKGRLDEVSRALDKLDLDQAQAERTDVLAQTLLVSEADKAARKAAQPAALVGGIAYKKLLIDKATAREKQALSAALLQAQRSARDADLLDLRLQKLQLESKITDLNTAMAKMSVKPKLQGMVIHNVGFNGDKFTSGSQIYMGQSVAQVADLTSCKKNFAVVLFGSDVNSTTLPWASLNSRSTSNCKIGCATPFSIPNLALKPWRSRLAA